MLTSPGAVCYTKITGRAAVGCGGRLVRCAGAWCVLGRRVSPCRGQDEASQGVLPGPFGGLGGRARGLIPLCRRGGTRTGWGRRRPAARLRRLARFGWPRR